MYRTSIQHHLIENDLETCDIKLPLPRNRQEDAPQFYRFLLLSAIDVQPPAQAMVRIERLFHQTGGHHVGIIFLLQEKTRGNGMGAYLSLQASLVGAFDINIIPLHSVSSLSVTIGKFWQQIAASPRSQSTATANPATVLLPYCSLKPPIQEHLRNIITENVHRIGDLSELATTREGKEALRELLPETGTDADDIIGFWEQEFVL
ncbi:hypothetical protein HYFRA_00006837 [Hymenoscyphus fraxineus]|uniref:Uncharacterized protein n=1 Tax=Hymenoscyphus fraxineus TaxID=746836 RepID=A0A9N9PFF9_9HELO|nr:hypothetical protein HYFRA_00006837 [Hymenoscyphus fraxineus]